MVSQLNELHHVTCVNFIPSPTSPSCLREQRPHVDEHCNSFTDIIQPLYAGGSKVGPNIRSSRPDKGTSRDPDFKIF